MFDNNVKYTHMRIFKPINLVHSQACEHEGFWGSRQQLLAGKVIADYVDPDGVPLDPIFGVLLQPTAGSELSLCVEKGRLNIYWEPP